MIHVSTTKKKYAPTQTLVTKRCARLLPDNFGAIQTIKGRYKKEWRCCMLQIEAKWEAEKKKWMDYSIVEVES
jgi:hypothetical protein